VTFCQKISKLSKKKKKTDKKNGYFQLKFDKRRLYKSRAKFQLISGVIRSTDHQEIFITPKPFDSI